MAILQIVIRPPVIIMSADLYLSVFLLSSFFRRLISELAEPNSIQIGQMVGSKCNLKTGVRNLGYPFPRQIGARKPAFWADFAT